MVKLEKHKKYSKRLFTMNTAGTKDMTTGNPARLLLAFSMPLMLGNLFQQFYTFADALIVGQYVGADALAALGASE